MPLHTYFKRLRGWFKSRHFGRSSVDTRYAILEACLIGVLSGFSALLLKQGVGWVGGWRIQATEQFGAWLVLPLGGLVFGFFTGWMMEQFSPAAAGGGIPQVKAALARFPVPLSLRVAVVKLIGTILVLGAGLTLGRRAPTVHIGAALAAQLSSWIPTSPEHRRQMIAAGAASGLAAGFATPIAGVLFVVEELMRDVSGITLETAIVASFTGAVVSLLFQSSNLNLPHPLFQNLAISFSAPEIPIYLLLGALAGVLGCLFNRGILWLMDVQRRLNLSLAWRIGLISLFSGTIIAILPPFFRDNTELRELLVTGELNWENMAITFVAYFFLTMLAYSSGAPGGLFAPALVLGSALGYIVGEVEVLLFHTGVESTYALAGMGAFFTAVVRAPVTAIIIVFELRANFNVILPLMITCAVSYVVAESIFSRSLYEHILQATGIQLSEENPLNDFLTNLKAVDVMQSQVETLEIVMTLDEVLTFMSKSHHRGFPVVDEGKLVGIVTQTDLDKVSDRSQEISLQQIMTPNPITVQTETTLSDVLYLLNRYQLSRLPVIEGQKIVGIITRTDIIRTEVKQLSGGPQIPKPSPSYIIYQTRSPATGKGRLLLPIANLDTASVLLQIATALARQQNYEVECLHVIKVPKHSPPDQSRVDIRESRKLMHRLERLGRHLNIPIHTQIRIGQDIAQTILETIQERHINLMLMGWQGKTTTQGVIFGDVVDILMHHAPCDVMLVKLGSSPNAYPNQLDSHAIWLVPISGGPNAQKALQLLPGLTKLYPSPNTPEIWLCRVYFPNEPDPDYQELQKVAESLEEVLDNSIIPIPICSRSISDAIIQLAEAEHCQLVVLGASRKGLIEQAIYGNIPEAIAQEIESTVILVRDAEQDF